MKYLKMGSILILIYYIIFNYFFNVELFCYLEELCDDFVLSLFASILISILLTTIFYYAVTGVDNSDVTYKWILVCLHIIIFIVIKNINNNYKSIVIPFNRDDQYVIIDGIYTIEEMTNSGASNCPDYKALISYKHINQIANKKGYSFMTSRTFNGGIKSYYFKKEQSNVK